MQLRPDFSGLAALAGRRRFAGRMVFSRGCRLILLRKKAVGLGVAAGEDGLDQGEDDGADHDDHGEGADDEDEEEQAAGGGGGDGEGWHRHTMPRA